MDPSVATRTEKILNDPLTNVLFLTKECRDPGFLGGPV